MSGFYIRRSGYTHVGELMLAVVADLTANGFTPQFPVAWQPPTDPAGRAAFKVILEAGPTVDPLNATAVTVKQPWRIGIQVFDKHTAGIVTGAKNVAADAGNFAFNSGASAGTFVGPLGCVGGLWTKGATMALRAPDPTKPEEGFINRTKRVVVGSDDFSDAYPMTYSLAISPRGVMLCVWEDYTSDSAATAISWMLIQRPVDRVTGAVVTTGKAPVFCVFSTTNLIKRFVSREADVLRPSDAVDATIDADYINAIINKEEQVAISEGNKYVVSFPSRLNTTRYAYTHELDMLGYSSADVLSEHTDVPLTVYGEAQPRTYASLLANGANNTGMRILTLKVGGGIDPAP